MNELMPWIGLLLSLAVILSATSALALNRRISVLQGLANLRNEIVNERLNRIESVLNGESK